MCYKHHILWKEIMVLPVLQDKEYEQITIVISKTPGHDVFTDIITELQFQSDNDQTWTLVDYANPMELELKQKK